MKLKMYSHPSETEWLGWVENGRGDIIAFVSLDGEVIWDW